MFRTPAITCLILSFLLHAFVGYQLTNHEPKSPKPEEPPVEVALIRHEPPPLPPPPPPQEPRKETPPPERPKPKTPVTPPENPITVPPQTESEDVEFTMDTDLTPDPTPPPPGDSTGPVFVQASLSAADRLREPKYPAAALREGAECEVTIRLQIDAGGNVSDSEILKSCRNREFDQSVRRHVRTLHFSPATEDGRAIADVRDFTFAFKMGGSSSLNLD